MRVLFVYSNITCSCTRKCCFELSEALKKYAVTNVIYFKDFNREIIKAYDIIIFQRVGTASNVDENDTKEMLRIINENKCVKKFVYLIDDLLLDVEFGTPKKFIKECNAVICTSKTLEEYIKINNKNVYRFHTFIDLDLYDSAPANKNDKFTLVWVSTGGLGKNIVREIINKKDEIGIDFKLIAIGGYAREFQKEKNVEVYPIINEYEMIKKIKGADILLNPMEISDDIKPTIEMISNNRSVDFLNCKSEVKYAIAGAIKACLLTSPVENYIKAIKNMFNGVILSDNSSEWIKMIKYLFNNKKLLNEIQINAYKNVKDEYTKEKVAEEFFEILKEIIN